MMFNHVEQVNVFNFPVNNCSDGVVSLERYSGLEPTRDDPDAPTENQLRTAYRLQAVNITRLVYQTVTDCCDGYSQEGSQCSPICPNCEEPRLCVAPGTCACPSGWAENDCSVPYDPPNSVSVAAISSTSIRVQWSPPSTPNGVIIHYTLYINDLPAITIPASTGRPSQSWVLDGLTDDSKLNVSLSASTKIGEGPLAKVATISTSQHGMGMVVIYYDDFTLELTVMRQKFNCSQWIEGQEEQLIETLAEGVSQGIEEYCHCAFPSNHIINEEVKCGEDTRVLTFTGSLVANSERSSYELILNLREWLSSQPTILAGDQLLQVVTMNTDGTGNSTVVSEPAMDGTPLWAIAVGAAGSALALLTVSVALISIAVYFSKRKRVSDRLRRKTPQQPVTQIGRYKFTEKPRHNKTNQEAMSTDVDDSLTKNPSYIPTNSLTAGAERMISAKEDTLQGGCMTQNPSYIPTGGLTDGLEGVYSQIEHVEGETVTSDNAYYNVIRY
ncbi:hypothetical protein GBAR_LOCUS22760 [Geodia barretti]|uniref:Fibronectin type-III domain-containing protein n=1 Tax=Geodia barretti TaxID=519541 RepID=A0AA35X629_GEOBA|nr:hypothetical protein GBAR_LOCUS22760 [Geodia barretti]